MAETVVRARFAGRRRYEDWRDAAAPGQGAACGSAPPLLPRVQSQVFSAAELAGAAGFLVNPEDVEDIARGMQQMATDEAARARSIEAGYVSDPLESAPSIIGGLRAD